MTPEVLALRRIAQAAEELVTAYSVPRFYDNPAWVFILSDRIDALSAALSEAKEKP